jgi:hypothetical protein
MLFFRLLELAVDADAATYENIKKNLRMRDEREREKRRQVAAPGGQPRAPRRDAGHRPWRRDGMEPQPSPSRLTSMKPTQSAPVLILLIALAGCGDPGASNSSEASNIPSWQAPDAYEFTLDSSCGERSLIGKFRVVVENGSVVEAEGLDESGRALFEHGAEDDVPTLSKLLDQAATAEEEGADVVEVEATDEGRPTAIDIDWDSNAIDDEACYRITAYSTMS